MTQKAVVLARGLGTRMQRADSGLGLGSRTARLAERGLKALIPVNGRPFLDYVVDGLLCAGLRRICLVIAPDADDMRRYARGGNRAAGVQVECAAQAEPLGTADAVLAAEQFAGPDPFVLTNGDNLFPVSAVRALADLEQGDCGLVAFPRDALVRQGNIGPERVKGFAVVRASESGELIGLVEKPADPDRYARGGQVLVSMNLYRFTSHIFDCCRAVEPDPDRGELELTAAVTDLIQSGKTAFRVLSCEEPVFDLTSRADIPAVERALKGRQLSF